MASLKWPLTNREHDHEDEESLGPDLFDRAWQYADTDLRGRPAYDGPGECDELSRLLLSANVEQEQEEPVSFTKRLGKIFGL